MSADGLLLASVFALCSAGALAGFLVSERRNPLLLAWVGSLAALALLWVGADVLASGEPLAAELWTIYPLGTLSVGLTSSAGARSRAARAISCWPWARRASWR